MYLECILEEFIWCNFSVWKCHSNYHVNLPCSAEWRICLDSRLSLKNTGLKADQRLGRYRPYALHTSQMRCHVRCLGRKTTTARVQGWGWGTHSRPGAEYGEGHEGQQSFFMCTSTKRRAKENMDLLRNGMSRASLCAWCWLGES